MSIIFQHLVRDSGGALPINLDTGPIVGGIPSQGLIINSDGEVEAVLDGTIAHYSYGLPFDADNRLCVTGDDPTLFDQGIPFAANGNVAGSLTDPPDFYNQGIGYNTTGGLSFEIQLPPDQPGQVMNLVTTIPVDNQVHNEWDMVVVTPDVTSYTLEHKESSSGVWIQTNVLLNLTADTLSLISGIQYDFRVFATNINGDGPASIVNQITVEGVPEQITDLAASTGDIESSDITWTPPTAGPAATRVDLHYRLTGTLTWFAFLDIPTSNTSQTIYDLQDNASYDFRIRYANSNSAAGAWSSTVTATPSQIGSPLRLELNEKGARSNTSTVLIQNTGDSGSSQDFGTIVGGGSISFQVRKEKDCFQTSGNVGLMSNTTPVPQTGQPATIIWVGIPFFLDGGFRLAWSSSFQISDASNTTGFTNVFAGNGISAPPMDTTSTPWIVIYRINGGSSSVRIIKDDNGATDSIGFGNAGSNNIAPEILSWNSIQSGSRDFAAQNMEFDWFNGSLSGIEETARINAVKQKWFQNSGFLGQIRPQPLVCLDETGIVSTGGNGTQITAWNNAGNSGGDDITSTSGTAANLTETTVNGLRAINVAGGVRGICSNGTTYTEPDNYAIYVVCDPTLLNASNKFLFNATGTVSTRVSTGSWNAFAGSTIFGAAGTTGLVVVCFAVGGEERLRIQGALSSDTRAFAGSNSFTMASLFWSNSETAGEDFIGDFCEMQVYRGYHGTATQDAIMSGLRNKWGF